MPSRFQTSQYHVDVSTPPPAGTWALSFNPPTRYVGLVLTPTQELNISIVDSDPDATSILIECDRGDGSGWVEITTLQNGYGNSGYNWTITGPATNSFRLRLTDDQGNQATSGVNVVRAPVTTELRVTSPQPGSRWKIGEQMEIRWDDVYTGNAKIALTDNMSWWESGSPFTESNNYYLATVPNTGSWTWTVSGEPRNACTIRIYTDNPLSSGQYGATSGELTIEAISGPEPDTPPRVTTTPQDILSELDMRLDNPVKWGMLERKGDGVTRNYYISERHVRQLDEADPDAVRVYKYFDSATFGGWSERLPSYEEWQFDYVNSSLRFMERDTPDEGQPLRVTYTYQEIPHTLLDRLVRSSFGYLFPAFYVNGTTVLPVNPINQYSISYTGMPPEGIIDVWEGDGESWPYRFRPSQDYRISRGSNRQCTLHLFRPSSSSHLRIDGAYRPVGFTSTRTTLTSLGLPETMRDCIIYYVLWQLHAQRLSPRMRYEQAAVLSASAATVRDQQTTTQLYKLLLDTEIDKRRMRLWTARGI